MRNGEGRDAVGFLQGPGHDRLGFGSGGVVPHHFVGLPQQVRGIDLEDLADDDRLLGLVAPFDHLRARQGSKPPPPGNRSYESGAL